MQKFLLCGYSGELSDGTSLGLDEPADLLGGLARVMLAARGSSAELPQHAERCLLWVNLCVD